ncbi:phosphopyruvate hydratase [Candidatus Parcubacteria bacterium 4484_255]|nr:MAG: phosphopyruvate hydratase [Candidatus Parcubacteria bacterium 4484_255]
MTKIKKIKPREILDSRGNPTIEVKVVLENNIQAKAAIPSGASTGKYEALELRDNDARYSGKGVLNACQNVEKIIAPVLIGQEIDVIKMDRKMLALDDTPNKSRLGANAILGVSLAVARAAAKDAGQPLYKYIREIYDISSSEYILPTPLFNIINGGIHSDSGLDIQEFMVIPVSPKTLKEKMRVGTEVFGALKEILKKKGLTFAVGDEGGFAPKLKNTQEAFKLLVAVTEFAKHTLGEEIFFGVDVAASVFYNGKIKKYVFEKKKRSSDDMAKIYWSWIKKYPLLFLEDPFDEDDWTPWPLLTKKVEELGQKILVVGDDLFATNIKRLEKGIANKSTNSILIKLNQIGTLTETMQCIALARKNNYKIIISHRSGETNDTFISDLAVAVNADFIKAGAPNRGERVAKYNRLMEIEDELFHIPQWPERK